VVATSLARSADEFEERVIETQDLRREVLRPALDATVWWMLTTAEAYGRVALDAWVCLPGDVLVAGGKGQRRPAATLAHEIHIAGELTIPAHEEETRELGLRWEREFGAVLRRRGFPRLGGPRVRAVRRPGVVHELPRAG